MPRRKWELQASIIVCLLCSHRKIRWSKNMASVQDAMWKQYSRSVNWRIIRCSILVRCWNAMLPAAAIERSGFSDGKKWCSVECMWVCLYVRLQLQALGRNWEELVGRATCEDFPVYVCQCAIFLCAYGIFPHISMVYFGSGVGRVYMFVNERRRWFNAIIKKSTCRPKVQLSHTRTHAHAHLTDMNICMTVLVPRIQP